MVSEVLDKSTDDKQEPLFHQELIPRFQQGFHCVILDLKDLPSHLFRRIVTFNNWQSYCLDSSLTLTFSHQLDLFSSFSSTRGEIHMAIHEIAVNLDNSLSFSWVTLVWARYPSYPSQGYLSNANSNKETKEVWTLQPKPSLVQLEEQLEEQHRLGATVQPYPAIM